MGEAGWLPLVDLQGEGGWLWVVKDLAGEGGWSKIKGPWVLPTDLADL